MVSESCDVVSVLVLRVVSGQRRDGRGAAVVESFKASHRQFPRCDRDSVRWFVLLCEIFVVEFAAVVEERLPCAVVEEPALRPVDEQEAHQEDCGCSAEEKLHCAQPERPPPLGVSTRAGAIGWPVLHQARLVGYCSSRT